MLGTALVWAGAYALVGLAVGAVFWVSGTTWFVLGGPGWLGAWAEVGAITGAISGGVFSLTVMALERRGDFSLITPLRFGTLGALTAGIVMAIIWSPQSILFGSIGAAIGFACGSGSVIVARRALPAPQSPMKSIPSA
jgi:hypothetical protein